MDQKAVDYLIDAKTRISIRKNWLQFGSALAKDKHGKQIDPESSEAVSWCAAGSMHVHMDNFGVYLRSRNFLEWAANQLYNNSVIGVSMSFWFPHTRVLKMYDRAIELAKVASSGF